MQSLYFFAFLEFRVTKGKRLFRYDGQKPERERRRLRRKRCRCRRRRRWCWWTGGQRALLSLHSQWTTDQFLSAEFKQHQLDDVYDCQPRRLHGRAVLHSNPREGLFDDREEQATPGWTGSTRGDQARLATGGASRRSSAARRLHGGDTKHHIGHLAARATLQRVSVRSIGAGRIIDKPFARWLHPLASGKCLWCIVHGWHLASLVS